MALTVHAFDDVEAFLEATGDFLAAREAEHNLIFGISSWIRDHPELVSEPPTFHAVTDASAGVVLASLRTPPHNQVLSTVDEIEAVDLLVDALATDLPGVLAEKRAAARFAERWSGRTGGRARVQTAERIFRHYFDGDPWVKRESPVRSIDRRVTRAVRARGL
jgi:hypothetical protein